MELEDFLPEKPEFKLKSTGKTYALRLPNLEDQVWLKNKYGSAEAFNETVQKFDWSKSILFIYRLLVDKADFMSSTEASVDDDGNSVKTIETGPFKLLKAIQNADEAKEVMAALAQAIILSNPSVKGFVAQMVKDEVKKNPSLNKPTKQTGLKSSTLSPRSMAGKRKR